MSRAPLLLSLLSLLMFGCPSGKEALPDQGAADQKVTKKDGGKKPPDQKVTKKDGGKKPLDQKVTKKDSGKKPPDQKLTKKDSGKKPPDQKLKLDQKPKPDQKLKSDLPKPDQKLKSDLPKPDQKPLPDIAPQSKFGTYCTNKSQCSTGQICLAVVPPGPGGYCTKKCTKQASICTGAPAGMRARCTWQGGPGIYYCAFICKDGPFSFACPPNHKCNGSSCTPL